MISAGLDGKSRCFGGEPGKEIYARYHDEEWGVPSHDDQHLFEMLILEGAQAGLSWEIILKKREGYRGAFHQFDPAKVASMTDEELEGLMENTQIIRNYRKIFSARQNARVFLEIQKEYGSFDTYLWRFVGGRPLLSHLKQFSNLPRSIPECGALSKDLKKRGMSFVGPSIIYAYMQAVGLVNDHLMSCWLHKG